MLSRLSPAGRTAPLVAARPRLPLPSRLHGLPALPSRQLHLLSSPVKCSNIPILRPEPQKRHSSSGSASSGSSSSDPVGFYIGLGLGGLGLMLHAWVTSLVEHKVGEVRTELYDVRRKLRDDVREVDNKVHKHYLEFLPIQYDHQKLKGVRSSAVDKWDMDDALMRLRCEVGAVRHQQAALEGMFDKLEKQKLERRRKKEEMANRRLV